MRLANDIHKFLIYYISAILVKLQKTDICQVGKRKIQNQKMIDKWGNGKQASPVSPTHKDFQSI